MRKGSRALPEINKISWRENLALESLAVAETANLRGIAAPVLFHLHHQIEVYARAEQLFKVGTGLLPDALDGLPALPMMMPF